MNYFLQAPTNHQVFVHCMSAKEGILIRKADAKDTLECCLLSNCVFDHIFIAQVCSRIIPNRISVPCISDTSQLIYLCNYNPPPISSNMPHKNMPVGADCMKASVRQSFLGNFVHEFSSQALVAFFSNQLDQTGSCVSSPVM